MSAKKFGACRVVWEHGDLGILFAPMAIEQGQAMGSLVTQVNRSAHGADLSNIRIGMELVQIGPKSTKGMRFAEITKYVAASVKPVKLYFASPSHEYNSAQSNRYFVTWNYGSLGFTLKKKRSNNICISRVQDTSNQRLAVGDRLLSINDVELPERTTARQVVDIMLTSEKPVRLEFLHQQRDRDMRFIPILSALINRPSRKRPNSGKKSLRVS